MYKVSNLFNHKNIDVNIQDTVGNTPLITTCQSGKKNRFATAKMLLTCKDIQINAVNKYGDSAKFFAKRYDYDDGLLKLLEKHGA